MTFTDDSGEPIEIVWRMLWKRQLNDGYIDRRFNKYNFFNFFWNKDSKKSESHWHTNKIIKDSIIWKINIKKIMTIKDGTI